MENHGSSDLKSDPIGALIVLEGLDHCGKNSQCIRLLSTLEGLGHSVESWRSPDRNTGVGKMISSYLSNQSQLDDHAIHLLFSANRWEKRKLLKEEVMEVRDMSSLNFRRKLHNLIENFLMSLGRLHLYAFYAS